MVLRLQILVGLIAIEYKLIMQESVEINVDVVILKIMFVVKINRHMIIDVKLNV